MRSSYPLGEFIEKELINSKFSNVDLELLAV